MMKLLSANLFRLRKSALFWLMLVLSFGFGVFMCETRYREQLTYDCQFTLDSVFFCWALLIGLVLSVFLPLFLGIEHSDGTLRNKLIVGQDRRSIYLANLMTAFVSSILFSAAYMLACAMVGIPLMGGLTAKTGLILTSILGTVLMEAAWCAIFTLVIMSLNRKAAAAVSCILLFLALFVAAFTVYQVLDAPEFHPAYSLVDGEMVMEMVPNPAFLTEAERPIYEFLLDLNPVGQGVQYADLTPTRPIQLALCSLGVIAVTTAAGAALFQRKDLK